MKIDFSRVIMGLNGKPLPWGGNGASEIDNNFTLGKAVCFALMHSTEKQTGEEKYKSFKLAEKIMNKEEVEVSIEEVAKFKKMIGDVMPASVIGPCWDMLENKDK
jgi:hypothetical protein